MKTDAYRRSSAFIGGPPVFSSELLRERPLPHPHQNQRGFALLLVFLMAALIAITLYMELPRLAMQTQREKEQTLIDRGEQYKRAIQLFVAKAKRYPGDIKELESFQNQRFLRHRYEDPMTGKDEWRLIHIQNGVLTDSKLTKPTGPGSDKDKPSGPNGFVGEQAGLAGTQNQNPGGGAASQRDRRRPSESANATMPGPAVPGAPGTDQSGGQNPGNPGLPGQATDQNGANGLPQQAGIQGYTPGVSVPGQAPAPQGFPGQQGYPGQGTIPGQTGMPGIPGRGMMPTNNTTHHLGQQLRRWRRRVRRRRRSLCGRRIGHRIPARQSGPDRISPSRGCIPARLSPDSPEPRSIPRAEESRPIPYRPAPTARLPGFPQPGTTPGQPNAAADMIRNILTTPRPGGMPQGVAGAQTIGGGIAGVATTAEGEGVKVYNDRTLYQEWEFIYDPAKQKRLPNPNATGAGGTPADRMNQGSQPQTTTSPGSFGSSPSSSPMGSPMGRPPGQ